MEQPTPEAAICDVVRNWSRLSELADFAAHRHGFGDTDGGFGVTYPSDLDDFDRASGENIPAGFVKVYGYWGSPTGYEIYVPEMAYLETLASVLLAAGHTVEAQRVRILTEQKRHNDSSRTEVPEP